MDDKVCACWIAFFTAVPTYPLKVVHRHPPLGSMSPSTLKQLLIQLLSRFLKFLASIRGLPPCRLVNRIFAFLASLRRWTRPTNPRGPTLYQRQKQPTSSTTLDSGIVCAMNVPSPGPSDTHERVRPSPTDSPYTNARSPSGHLIPFSPAPARHYSRDYIPWMAGSQTSLHEEPSEINHGIPQVAADSILLSSSSTTVHGSHTPSSDILTHPSHPPSPLHQTISFAPEPSPGTPSVKTSPRAAHLHFDPNQSEPHRSRTPLSMKSSKLSVSQKSFNSRNSIGRASYRVHHGQPARARTPASNQDAPVFGPPSSPTLRRAEPGGSAVFGTIIAPPSADDPNRPGEPVGVGEPRFCPMSVSGVLRYDCRMTRYGAWNI